MTWSSFCCVGTTWRPTFGKRFARVAVRHRLEVEHRQGLRLGLQGEEHGLAEAVVWNGAVWFFGGYTKKDFSKCGTSIVLPPCAAGIA